MGLLQEFPASQQAISSCLTNVDNNQARTHLQQHRQAQPAHQPQQAAIQLTGGVHSMASATNDAIQQVAVTAGVKANAKQAAYLWRVNKGPILFIARIVFNVSEKIYRGSLVIVLDSAAQGHDAVLKQLSPCPISRSRIPPPPWEWGRRRGRCRRDTL